MAVYHHNPMLTPKDIQTVMENSEQFKWLTTSLSTERIERIFKAFGLTIPKESKFSKDELVEIARNGDFGSLSETATAGEDSEPRSEAGLSTADWVAMYISDEDDSPSLEGYQAWSKTKPGAPDSSEVRRVFGSWKEAKKAAQPAMG